MSMLINNTLHSLGTMRIESHSDKGEIWVLDMSAKALRAKAYHFYRARLEVIVCIPSRATDNDIHEMIEAVFRPAALSRFWNTAVQACSIVRASYLLYYVMGMPPLVSD